MKIAVITGASSGMGLEFAKAIDAEETLDEVWLIARRRDRLEELSKSLKAKCRILPLDLGKSESFDEYKALLEKEKPLISTLCNAAGFGRFALFTETELEVNLAMIDLNDKALVAMTGTFWDTVVICALTGIVLVSSIMAYPYIDYTNDAALTQMAFSKIPYIGTPILSMHSAREMMAWADYEYTWRSFCGFYKL